MINNRNAQKPAMPPRPPRPPRKYPELSAAAIIERIKKCCGEVNICKMPGKGSDSPYTLFLLPEAAEELCAIINYGRRSPMNAKEQRYNGYGHIFADPAGGWNIVVTHFIQIFTMNRTATSASNLGPNGEHNPGLDFVEYYRNEFWAGEKNLNTDAFGNMVDPFLEYGASVYAVFGHSHPGLGVFFSGPDRASGQSEAGSNPLAIVVVDPIRKELKAAFGAEFRDMNIVVCQHKVHPGILNTSGWQSGRDSAAAQPAALPETAAGTTAGTAAALAAQLPEAEKNVVALASDLIAKKRGCKGKIKCRTGFDGKVHVNISLVMPKKEKWNR